MSDVYKVGGKCTTAPQEDVQTMYLCGSCGTDYETKAEAKKCCCSYVCSECESEYDEKADAVKCCLAYGCEYCGEEYPTKKEAVACANSCEQKNSE